MRQAIVAVEKAISITYSEFLSIALVNQHVVRMRRVILSHGPVWPYHVLSHYITNSTTSGGGKKIECKMYVST